jgi:hypothetical protein
MNCTPPSLLTECWTTVPNGVVNVEIGMIRQDQITKTVSTWRAVECGNTERNFTIFPIVIFEVEFAVFDFDFLFAAVSPLYDKTNTRSAVKSLSHLNFEITGRNFPFCILGSIVTLCSIPPKSETNHLFADDKRAFAAN